MSISKTEPKSTFFRLDKAKGSELEFGFLFKKNSETRLKIQSQKAAQVKKGRIGQDRKGQGLTGHEKMKRQRRDRSGQDRTQNN